MKLSHLGLTFLLLIITQKNFGMGLRLRKSPSAPFAMGRAARDAYYHPETLRTETTEEYDPSCKDLVIAYDAFILFRQVAQTVLPNDPVIPGLVGGTAFVSTLLGAQKIKTALNVTMQKKTN